MYRYDGYDHQMLKDRVAQFRDQTDRFLAGSLSDAEFLPLRLQNGLYVQRLAPMIRIAIPYGMLSSPQLRKLAFIARVRDGKTLQEYIDKQSEITIAHCIRTHRRQADPTPL